MHKSDAISKKFRGLKSAVKTGGLLVALGLLSLLCTLAVAGQQGANVQKKELTDKLGEGVSAKEPHFKLATKQKRTRDDRQYR